MLSVGLTGGIGAGKSTVASRLAEHGALLIDADAIAREVVEPGTPGLAAIVAEFGEGVLAEDGSLNRPAMAQRVFNDEAARGRLNGIVHPLIGERTVEVFAGAAEHAIVVHDVPLLVENKLAPSYHLVLIVDAPVDVRVRRLAESRGMPEADARARIASQADEQQRRAVADVWLDNSGSPDVVRAEVDALWSERLVPFEANVRLRRPASWGRALVEHDPVWSVQARRVLDRIRLVAGERAVRADHIGATAVPDVPARDVLDLQLTVRAAADVHALGPALADAGFPPAPAAVSPVPDAVSPVHDAVSPVHDAVSPVHDAVFHASADSGRPVSLRVLADDHPAARRTLLLRDWLRADADARAEYARIKREHAPVPGSGEPAAGTGYTQAKQTWLNDVTAEAEHWAAETGWTP